MSKEMKPSVLVCVTGQYDCDRLINKGFELAVEMGCDMHVLCVHAPVSNAGFLSDEIEYLYQTAKNLCADMTIAFSDDPAYTATDFAKKVNARLIITGMPDNKPNGFVDKLSACLPKTTIKMVTKESECLTYYHREYVSAPA